MIRYSHVSLIIICDTEPELEAVTAHLGVDPSRTKEDKAHSWSPQNGAGEMISYSWVLDSPLTHDDADVPERLSELADAIEPFAERLKTLKSKHKPWVDVLFHNTPQHPHGVTGEFHWFQMPADIMRRFSKWDLSISYEIVWFDHPDWKNPRRQTGLSGLLRRLKRGQIRNR